MAGSIPLAWTLADRLPLSAAGRIPAALQLYSVRQDCAQNFDAALEQVAAMGFEGVEFAGYYNYAGKAPELANRLKALKLKVAGTHVRMDVLRGDALTATIDFHQAIGCRFIVVPGDAAFTDPEKSKALADEFNQLAQTLKPRGMACGFHNHTGEFKKDGDKTYWDLFAERTTKDVILQQDCGWTLAAGFDPVAYIRKYPGRTKTTHFKPTVRQGETDRKAILGQDSVDWKAVYDACSSVGGTEWIVLEQETYPDGKSPMDCTRESFASLRTLLAS
ncbi:MAG: sugar phosphate isomerase/epimerase [Acidobacteria bacterium]|nr:sugar phosphate isomerase/epimerase [Acidobacteriota bacterium]